MLEARIAHSAHCASSGGGGGGSSSTAAVWNAGLRPQLSVGLALEMPDGTETTITVRTTDDPIQLARSFLDAHAVGSGRGDRAQLEMVLAQRIRDALDSLHSLPLPQSPHGYGGGGGLESSLDALDSIAGSWSTHQTPLTYREPQRRIWGGIPLPPSYSSPMGPSTMGPSTMGASSDFGLRV